MLPCLCSHIQPRPHLPQVTSTIAEGKRHTCERGQVCKRRALVLFHFFFFYAVTINISSALPERASRASVIHDPCEVLGIIQHRQYVPIHVPLGRTEDRAING